MSNAELKKRAINDLIGYYWLALLTTFIFTLLNGITDSIGKRIALIVTGESIDYSKYIEYLQKGDPDRASKVIMEANSYPAVTIVTIIVAIFLLNHLKIGHKKAYVNASKTGHFEIGDLFAGFSNYGSILKTMFFYDLYLFLWSLLFIIPCIIKYYSYYMVPFILTENPYIDTKRAFEISKNTMNGEKGKAFYMELSFIGWYLLGLIVCCIGFYFILPYPQATYTQFYKYVKQKSLATGIATPTDYGEA